MSEQEEDWDFVHDRCSAVVGYWSFVGTDRNLRAERVPWYLLWSWDTVTVRDQHGQARGEVAARAGHSSCGFWELEEQLFFLRCHSPSSNGGLGEERSRW